MKNTAGSRPWGWSGTFRHPWFWGQLTIIFLLGIVLLILLFNPKKAENTLAVGCDMGGGAPYYIEEDGTIKGFEARLVRYLAAKQNTKEEFVNAAWDSLLPLLKRGNVRMVVNGFEWSADREREFASTIPYYVYRLQLIARKNDTSIRTWKDLRSTSDRSKKKVGVLRGTKAEAYLRETYGDDIEVVALSEEGSTGVMKLVANGQLDATVQDTPAAHFYLKVPEFEDLEARDVPIEPDFYVIYVNKDDTQLLQNLNESLREAIRDGTLERFYSEYGMWNADQEDLAKMAFDWPPEIPALHLSWWKQTLGYAKLLLQGAGMTIFLSLLSMPLAMLTGLIIAVGRLYGPRWLERLLRGYVELIRGTPLLLQIYVIYFLLPEIGVMVPAFIAAVAGLAINYSAYEAENYRAGFLAIPSGQMEAALALGMSKGTALRRVIIPQAVRVVIPTVTNDFISLFKDTSICSVVAVSELTGQYSRLTVNNPGQILLLGGMTALLYLLMSYPLALVARRLETQYSRIAQ